jgi:hypothetical protein
MLRPHQQEGSLVSHFGTVSVTVLYRPVQPGRHRVLLVSDMAVDMRVQVIVSTTYKHCTLRNKTYM